MTKDTAHGIKLISREASERIARFSFEYAKKKSSSRK
jgi:isocitrate/isopropylmalate dehydrogenase